MAPKSTTEEFISKSIKVHGDKYDYSKTIYENNLKEVIIICKEHGEFEQTPANHLQGKDCCPKCGMNNVGKWNKSNKDKFVKKAIIKFGDKYDYSLVNYIDCYKEIKIICKTHNINIITTPTYHLKNNGYDCKECLNIFRLNFKKSNKTEFIEKAKIIHGDKYDYSLVDYKRNDEKIIIICKEHGVFEQTPGGHLVSTIGCIKCSGVNKSNKTEFIEKAQIIHGDKYDYSDVIYIGSNSPVIIICKTHGKFLQTPSKHTNSKQGCIKCSGNYQLNTEEFIKKSKYVHGDKYDYSMSNYINSNTKVIIICKKCGEFEQNPYEHYNGHNCPHCVNSNYSKISILYLNFMSIYYNIIIQHAENSTEFIIPNTKYKADGYCKETNTIYEFHGNFWHGNPKIYRSEHINKRNKCTFGELYEKTMQKEKNIKELGYNLVVMWESEWNKINKSIRCLQRKWRNK